MKALSESMSPKVAAHSYLGLSLSWGQELFPHCARCVIHYYVPLFVTPWTGAHQAPPSVGFPRQEYWSRVPFPSPGDLPPPKDWTLVSCIAGRLFTIWATRGSPWKPRHPDKLKTKNRALTITLLLPASLWGGRLITPILWLNNLAKVTWLVTDTVGIQTQAISSNTAGLSRHKACRDQGDRSGEEPGM